MSVFWFEFVAVSAGPKRTPPPPLYFLWQLYSTGFFSHLRVFFRVFLSVVGTFLEHASLLDCSVAETAPSHRRMGGAVDGRTEASEHEYREISRIFRAGTTPLWKRFCI